MTGVVSGARSDRAITEALDAFRRIIRAIRNSARRTERELGVSGAQLFVLQQLAEGSAASLNELAERTHTHQSSVSVVVRRLVDRGLVSRRASRRDARRIEVALSSSGRALLRRSGPAVQVRLIRALSRMSPGHRRQLAGMLRRMVQEMGLGGTPAPMIFTEMQSDTPRRENRGQKRPSPPRLRREERKAT